MVQRSHRVVRPPRGIRTRSHSPVSRVLASLELRLRSRVSPRLRPHPKCGPLSRGFLPHSATQSSRATNPGLASSGSCCVFALTMYPDALLPQGPPRCLSTERAHGVRALQSMTGRRSPLSLDAAPPLLRLAARSSVKARRPARNPESGSCSRKRLATGVCSLRQLGHPRPDLSGVAGPWLSWVSSSLGHSPSHRSASYGCRPLPRANPEKGRSYSRPDLVTLARTVGRNLGLLSCTSRRGPF